MLEPSLLYAYRYTDYFINLGAEQLCVRVDEPCPALDSLLRACRCNSAALITADNPRSLLLTGEQNQQRRQQLDTELQQRQFISFQGFNRAQRGEWPDEQTRLVLGIAYVDAETLARQFEQNSFLFFEPQKAVQLCLVDFS